MIPDKLKEGFLSKDRKELPVQLAKTMIIACCDARSDPAILFQTNLNDIFVLRSVANLVPRRDQKENISTAAALEFAVKGLSINNLIISTLR